MHETNKVTHEINAFMHDFNKITHEIYKFMQGIVSDSHDFCQIKRAALIRAALFIKRKKTS